MRWCSTWPITKYIKKIEFKYSTDFSLKAIFFLKAESRKVINIFWKYMRNNSKYNVINFQLLLTRHFLLCTNTLTSVRILYSALSNVNREKSRKLMRGTKCHTKVGNEQNAQFTIDTHHAFDSWCWFYHHTYIQLVKGFLIQYKIHNTLQRTRKWEDARKLSK